MIARKTGGNANTTRHHLHFNTTPEQYARVAQEQRAAIRAAADAIERGEPFDDARLEVVAALRARAQQSWRGRAPKGAPKDRTPERAALGAAADAIERGESFDATIVAKALRAWADSLSGTQPKANGRPRKADHAAIALAWVAAKRKRAVSDTALRAELAERHGVDAGTVRYALKTCGATARRFDAQICAMAAQKKK